MGDGNIFISYRREDSAGYTRAISDQLAQRFSKTRIFMDVDSIEPGLPFDQVIQNAVGRCDVLLAMIGRRWLEPREGSGPRLNDPKDFVRIEIAAALSRDIRVIPVLLDGAAMPTEQDLPEPLRPLAFRNAIEVSNSRFASDVERLADAIGKALGKAVGPGSWGRMRSRRPVLYGLLGSAAAIALGSAATFVTRRPSVPVQGNWRFCNKCLAMFFAGGSGQGTCAAGGAHVAQGFNFVLAHDVAGPGQRDWRFCNKCCALFFDGYPGKGVCPAGGAHVAQGFNFVVPHDVDGPGQRDWRFCQKCQAMFFDGYPAKGTCPAGDGHAAAGHNFVLPYA
jgi:hypothetical protein